MTPKLLKTHFAAQLQEEYPESEINSFFYLLTEAYLNMNRLQIALDPKMKMDETKVSKFENALKRLKQHEPIQYILGNTSFFGLDFKVNRDVLIPRPETEELVSWILEDAGSTKQFSSGKIIDIGAGSGCIAISLAQNLPKAAIFALDISSAALQTAQENAAQNEVHIEFLQEDILQKNSLIQDFDVIVSNPPYVRQLEKEKMQRNVLENEPASALYVENDDALIFYRKIAELAKDNLTKNGAAYVECNQYLAKETEQIFLKKGFKTELRKDIFGNERMLKAVLTD